ncbi:MAG: PAS domain S-box protein [Proteobacteria bacterium]|jgi:PAS domain S-box-containing protein|nr:PAS domain S-box protein [Pseudomonadota bacterium]
MDSKRAGTPNKDIQPTHRQRVSELERLQEELKKSKINERRYKEFYNNATDIVFTVDRKGHFRNGNDRISEVIGYSVEEGLTLDWNQLVAPHEWNRASQIYRDHAAGEDTLFFELDLVTKEGEICTVEINSRPVLNKSKVTGFQGIARDISERKRVEKSLEQARLRAEAAELSKSRLLAKVSHEIRTPLHGVMNLLTAIDTSKLSESDQNMVAPIDRSIRHLIHLVDDTLNFAYLESGQSTVRNIPFSLTQIAKACAARHKHMAEKKSLFLHLDLESTIPERISGDATKITQILDNLITNAIRYTQEGGVTIRIFADNENKQKSHLTIIISDTGPGIHEEQLKRIFEPFQRGDDAQSQSNDGVGLGLAITKRLVETLGCTLKAKSTLGNGSQFTLNIPNTFTIAPQENSKKIEQFDGSQQTALVIDDDEVSNIFLINTLAATGVEVTTCFSGKAAQEILQIESFDLIFMDQHLGDIKGTDLAPLIHKDKNTLSPKIICVTADIELHQTLIDDSPFDQILLKPCSQKDLISALGLLIDPDICDRKGRVLDKSAGLDLASGDQDTWEKALKIFTDRLPATITRLQSHYQNTELEKLRETSHKLTGSSRYVGAQNLAECCVELVRACKRNNTSKLGIAVDSLVLAADKFLSTAPSTATSSAQSKFEENSS